MRRSCLLLSSLLLSGVSVAAHATPITPGTYNLVNAFVGGYALTGTLTVNSTGNATSANLVFQDPDVKNPGLPTLNQVSSTGAYNGLSQNYIVSSSSSGQLTLFFNTSSNANGNFDLCLGSAQCGTSAGTTGASALQIYGFYNNATGTSNPGLQSTNLNSGYLTTATTSAQAVTPEPSSLFLLSTGILGIAGAGRLLKA